MPRKYGQGGGDPPYQGYYSACQSFMDPEPVDCTNCKKLERNRSSLANKLEEKENACASLEFELDNMDRKHQFENQQANNRYRTELTELRKCAQENQKQFESVMKRAREDQQKFELVMKQTRTELLRLREQLFAARKAEKRFAEAESIYHEIIDPLPPQDRGAKSNLMYEFADMLIEQKNYAQAEVVAQEALGHRKSHVKTDGQGSMEVKLSFRQLSSALFHQDSEKKQKQAMEMHRQIWENDAPHDWKAENGDRLCQIYAHQKKYDPAQRIQYEVWEERRRKCGIRHEATMNSALQRIAMLDGIMSALDKEHRCHPEKDVEKEFWKKKIIDFLREIWNSGKEAAETDAKVHDIGHRLGESLDQRMEYLKAGEIFKQVWEGRKKSLGDKDIKTLDCGHRLGEIYWKQKDYVNAGEVFEQVLQGKKESLGDTNPKTLECGHRLGEIRYQQKRYDKAMDVFSQVWIGRNSSPGDKNLHVLASGHRLGEIHLIRKEYPKAETVLSQVWNARQSNLGESHPETVESAHQLATSIYAQADSDKGKLAQGIIFSKGRWKASMPILEKSTASSSSFLGAFDNSFMYGSLLVKSGYIPDAEKVLQPLWELKVGPEAETLQLRVGHFWGICLARQNHYARAREVFESVRHRRSAASDPNLEDCLDTAKELKNVCDLIEVEEKRLKTKIPKKRVRPGVYVSRKPASRS
ncbi:hypothetical protein MMC07_001674 [Pseudocyphellaria aurata]|nr:hypothetical protein [Pseudocyphellaria aurata]